MFQRCLLLIVAVLTQGACTVPAQAQVRPYDGIQAGLDAFRLAEERRQAGAALQIAHNSMVRSWGGFSVALPVANLDYAYAYGGYPPPQFAQPVGGALTVFEPWPYVPGDIYGYTYYLPARQPVAQVQMQTGPNRWESHPVYDPPLADYRPLPPVASPLLNNTPYAAPVPVLPVIPALPATPVPPVAVESAPPASLPPLPPIADPPRRKQREF